MDFGSLLVSPATPFVALSLVGTLIAVLGLVMVERQRHVLVGIRTLPNQMGMNGRFIVGQIAGVPIAGLIILIAFAVAGTNSQLRTLMITCAGAIYLYVGVVVPRKPIVQQQKEDRDIRSLLPGFINYLRVSIEGYDAPITLMERYVERPNERIAVLQNLVRDALRLHETRQLRPFEALFTVARMRKCQELIDVTEQLAQSERDGTSALAALEAFQKTLELILKNEFQRMLKRRMMYLMATVAVSLVIGILANLLFVMTKGGQLGGI